MRRKLLCYAQGHEGSWQAFCLDLDLAVQGLTFEEVYAALRLAIQDYVEAALQEDDPSRKRLLNRKAPFMERMRFFWQYLTAVSKTNGDEMQHGSCVNFREFMKIVEDHRFVEGR